MIIFIQYNWQVHRVERKIKFLFIIWFFFLPRYTCFEAYPDIILLSLYHGEYTLSNTKDRKRKKRPITSLHQNRHLSLCPGTRNLSERWNKGMESTDEYFKGIEVV